MNEQSTLMNQQQQQHLMNVNQNSMGVNPLKPHQQQQPQPQMVPMNRNYGMWVPPPQFPNSNPAAMKQPSSGFNKALGPRNNWKGKKVNKPNDKRRKEQQQKPLMSGSSTGGIGGGVNLISGAGGGNVSFNSYQPPTLNDLQHQNRLKTWKFYPKKNFNKNKNMNMNMSGNTNSSYGNRSAPYAPRNTTSFLIRAKKSGGIASLVSPCPVTPAVLPTPIFSPSREVLVDMAKEEWGVDGYGTMKGLIRLRSPGHEMEPNDDEEEDEGGSSESDVEEHAEVERRLDHDLSRFEMIYDPNYPNAWGMEYHNVLENRVDDQDSHIAQLEEENLILKERLFLMERELADLRRRMQSLERSGNRGQEVTEEVLENESENDCDSGGDEARSMEDNNEDCSEDNNVQGDSKNSGDGGLNNESIEAAHTMEENVGLDVEPKAMDDKLLEADEKVDNSFENKEENFCQVFNKGDKIEDRIAVVEVRDENNNTDVRNQEAKKAEDDVGDGSSEMEQEVCMEEAEPEEINVTLDRDNAN